MLLPFVSGLFQANGSSCGGFPARFRFGSSLELRITTIRWDGEYPRQIRRPAAFGETGFTRGPGVWISCLNAQELIIYCSDSRICGANWLWEVFGRLLWINRKPKAGRLGIGWGKGVWRRWWELGRLNDLAVYWLVELAVLLQCRNEPGEAGKGQ